MTTKKPQLTAIMEYVGPGKGPESYKMWFCRGVSKGCKRRVLKAKRHCENCMEADDDAETLEHIAKRLERGNA